MYVTCPFLVLIRVIWDLTLVPLSLAASSLSALLPLSKYFCLVHLSAFSTSSNWDCLRADLTRFSCLNVFFDIVALCCCSR
ncbi:hypothetical protein FKM82_024465 [Ascaphus truei]